MLLIFINLIWLEINPGTFVSFIYVFIRFQGSIAAGIGKIGSIQKNKPQFKIALELLDKLQPEEGIKISLPLKKLNLIKSNKDYTHSYKFFNKDKTISKTPPEIKLKELEFSYFPNQKTIFSNLNLTIKSGSQFAIVGPSGSGKSTLLAIILGLIQPTNGQVLIDQIRPQDYFKKSSTPLGFVGAESFLIEGSISENIRYGAQNHLNISDQSCIKALREARLGDLIDAEPNFLDRKINENGEGLSAGQKQRLCLARALLVKPKFLILDEISANLDDQTELEIVDTVKKLKGVCTTIIVSHRSAMLKFADEIITID